jgi:methyl-accepting chemotaxis protein
MAPNFDQMLLAHSRWKTRLKESIEHKETIDARVAGKDDQCELGKWIYGEGKKYAGQSGYQDLKAKHTKFHACVANVVLQAATCPPAKAMELIDPQRSEYARVSVDCVNAIAEFKRGFKE